MLKKVCTTLATGSAFLSSFVYAGKDAHGIAADLKLKRKNHLTGKLSEYYGNHG